MRGAGLGRHVIASGKFELHQVRCFVAVAEELNFRRAAERLNMTQPPLSRQIRLLEHGLGVTLLERGRGGVRLTAAGEDFLFRATDLLQRAEFAVLSARQAERGEAGAIAIGFVPSAALDFIPRIVKAIGARMASVTLSPIEMMSYEIIEALRSGQLDLGLTRSPETSADIDSVRVVSEPLVLALPATHPLAGAGTPTLGDLDGLDFVGYSSERGGYMNEVLRGLFAAAGIAPRQVQGVSQTHSVLAMVNKGIGVALVPRSSATIRMDQLVYREIDTPSRFRSTLYLTNGPKGRTPLHEAIKHEIATELARDIL